MSNREVGANAPSVWQFVPSDRDRLWPNLAYRDCIANHPANTIPCGRRFEHPHDEPLIQGTAPVSTTNYLLEALPQSRTRSSWNDRLAHWEKPASDTEEAQIERAASMVRAELSSRHGCPEKA